MKMKPILFSTPMVQAILDGRKTQTRRLVKPQPDARGLRTTNVLFEDYHGMEIRPRFSVGDIMYVRETFGEYRDNTASGGVSIKTVYRADNNLKPNNGTWKPSLFMPKSEARIFLKVTDVRVERLQDISQEDAEAEGIKPVVSGEENKSIAFENYLNSGYIELPPVASFQSLWQSINGAESWEHNPWVFVYTFERIEKP